MIAARNVGSGMPWRWRERGKPTAWDSLRKYALESPVATATAGVLLTGGLLLLVYFARIGYLPDVNLEAVASVLYAVALLGLVIAGYAALTLVMPGLLLGTSRDGNRAIADKHVWGAAAASAIIWASIIVVLFRSRSSSFWVVATGAVAICALAATGFLARKGKLSQEQPLKVLKPLWWVVVLTVYCAFLMLVPMTFISMLGLHGDLARADDWTAIFTLIATASGIAFTAGLLGTLEARKRWRAAMLLAPLMLLLFSLLTGSFSAISVIVVARLGLGETPFVRAVVSSKTCHQVNQVLGQKVCLPAADDDAPVAICPAVLRSRIGSQVLLEFASLAIGTPKEDGKKARLVWTSPTAWEGLDTKEVLFRRVVLDKEQLLTWTSLPGQVKAEAASQSGGALASWVPAAHGGTAQPEAVVHALAVICGAPDAAATPERSGSAPLAPAGSASAPAVISIDAKGSASHQTVVNVHLQAALSQNSSASSTSTARSASEAKSTGARRALPPPVQECARARQCEPCCLPTVCVAASCKPGETAGPVPAVPASGVQ